ncbi:MAG TPA: hypothetical protein VMI54_13060 [Polyangiaceae bacterium]|nr:hypothetical protein [Polyangiaceae bacterium]
MLNPSSVPLHPSGARRPAPGSEALVLLVLGCALASVGCADDGRTRILPPAQVAMAPDVAPVFQTDEMTIYEVKKGLQFPILAPDKAMPASVNGSYAPYDNEPWEQLKDVRVQISWTLSNLDAQDHNVELLIDPWTEFGRYWPGLTLVDPNEGKYLPNLSGIDHYYQLASTDDPDKSRVNGTYTYDDCDELARDFATVMNLIKNPPTSEPGGQALDPADQPALLPTYVNHAFDFENISTKDPLVKQWLPSTIAGLTGIDFGLRTYEQATVALEIVVEVTDQGNDRVRPQGSNAALLPPTQTIITVGTAGPAM